MSHGGTGLAAQLHRAERRRKWRALALTLPLLAFLLVFFLVPLASLLIRAVENPEVADALPRTGQALAQLGSQQSSARGGVCGRHRRLDCHPGNRPSRRAGTAAQQ